MNKKKNRNAFKAFFNRVKVSTQNKRPQIVVGLLVACVVGVAITAIGCALLSKVLPANAYEAPYYSKLDGNYADVDSFSITVKDGVGPFDTNTDPTAADYCNRPGNDSSDSNGIVRSYDTVFYQLNYTTVLKDASKNVAEGFLWYKCVLPLSSEQADFDLKSGSTGWVGEENKTISELESSDENGYVLTEENGQQTLIGKVLIVPQDNNPAAIPGEGSLYIAVRVLKMYQGDMVSPKFSLWLDHSPVKPEVTPKDVMVTSQLRINISMAQISNGHMSGTVSTFDFGTGNEYALDKSAGNVYGVIRGYGITLQMYNDNNADGRNLKGCEMPYGDITFELNLEDVIYTKRDNSAEVVSLFDKGGIGNEAFKPLIWSFDSNLPKGTPMRDGRDITEYAWTGAATSVAPTVVSRTGWINEYKFTAGKNNTNCSGGGTWSAERVDNSTVRIAVENYYPVESRGNTLDYFTTYPSHDVGHSETFDYKYFNPLDYNYDNPLGSISTACFTAGKFYVVVPLSDENGAKLLDTYGEGTLSWNISIDNESLKVASQNAPSVNTDEGLSYRKQTNISDDKASSSFFPSEGGTYETIIGYSEDVLKSYDVKGSHQWIYNGLDKSPIGQNDIGIHWGVTGLNIGSNKAIYAANILLKFDDEALEPLSSEEVANIKQEEGRNRILPYPAANDNQSTSKTSEYTYLYAAKADGSGWTDNDEMNNTITEDLVYYRTIDDLKNDSKVCVGVLCEFRDSKPPEEIYRVYIRSYLSMKMKENYDLVGNTYQTVVYATVWNAQNLGIDSATDTQDEIKAKLPASLLNGNVTLPTGILINCDANGKPKKYNVTEYDEYTNPQLGYSEDKYLGDSLHIVGYEATVKKEVMNKTSSGETKTTFNLNYEEERKIDYKISPVVKYGADGLSFDQTTSIMVVDTIPAGLIYNEDYECVWSDETKKYDGLECILKKHEEKENGDTELTWILNGVRVGEEAPCIKYSCNISTRPELVKIGDSFTNTVTIAPLKNGVPVGFPIDVRNGNKATAAIKVTGLSQISFSKFADKPVYDAEDADDPLSWTMYMGNNSSSTYKDEVWLDVLPYNRDENGSIFGFPLIVKSLTLYGDNAPNTFTSWEVYYTTDISVRTTNASAYSANEIRNGESGGIKWEKLTVTIDGSKCYVGGFPDKDKAQPTAIAIIGNLQEKEIFKANIAVENTSSKPGEILGNRFSRQNANVIDTVRIVTRSISGLTWWDENADGVQGDGENIVTTGLKVTLMKLNESGKYEPFKLNGKELSVSIGTRISGLTGETEEIDEGSYEFTDLPAGTYGVRIEPEDNKQFAKWSISPKDVAGNSNDEKDSDATALYEDKNYKLLRADITDIVLPVVEYASDGSANAYIKRDNNDSGLYAYTRNFSIKKLDASANTPIEGVEFTLYYAEIDANGEWKEVDGSLLDDLLNKNITAISDENGIVLLEGIAPGNYILRETKVADGYHAPKTYWKLTVDRDGTVTFVDEQGEPVAGDEDGDCIITNKPGPVLPLTGGIGTVMFYVVGSLLMAAGIVVLFCQRKRRYSKSRV